MKYKEMNPNLQADMLHSANLASFTGYGEVLRRFLEDVPNVYKVTMSLEAMTMGKPCYQVTVYMEQYIPNYANSHGGWNPKTQKYDDAENGEAWFMHNDDNPTGALEACIEQYKKVTSL